VVTQLRKGVGDDLEGLLLAFREVAFRACDVCIHVGPRFLNRFDQQPHKLLRAFDVVKWSLPLEAQTLSSWAVPVPGTGGPSNRVASLRIPDWNISTL